MAEWGWAFCDGDDYCIGDVVAGDDVEELLSYLKSPSGSQLDKLEFTRSIAMFHAVNIATAMLEGKLGVRIDVNEYNLLHHAARMGYPKLVKLFLSNGARTDIRSTKDLVMADEGLLPLAIALNSTSRSLSLRNWTLYPRGQSILNLIATICGPKMHGDLATVELLAGSSKDVEEEAYSCAMEGKLIELAVLLLVAREKVLVPLTFPSEDGAGSARKMTIHQCVKDQLVRLIYEEIKLRREFKPEKLTQVQRNIMVMGATALLLEVFEKAGSTIDEFRQLQKHEVTGEQMEKDLALRLEEAGFKFEDGDFHFSIRDCLNSDNSAWIRFEHLETPSDKSSQFFTPSLPMLQQTNSPFSHKKELPRDGDRLSVSTHPLLKTCVLSSMDKSNNADQIAKSISSSQYSTNVDVQLKNRKNVIEQTAKYLSREKLAYMARFIKR